MDNYKKYRNIIEEHKKEHTAYDKTFDRLLYFFRFQKGLEINHNMNSSKITIYMYETELLNITWSYNEPKLYIKMQNRTFRIVNSGEALIHFLNAAINTYNNLDTLSSIYEL